ncbi:hypothetical protein [Absidia glauca]|uniref:Retrotransposon gag domain-containing protein n=1 Tax=Absidia glauca TaxID=4829 RepID=A0A163J8Y2_ABSGL|nr:hypothetical protein [Absidia glauca]
MSQFNETNNINDTPEVVMETMAPVNTSTGTFASGLNDSKHAPPPDIKAMLDQARKNASRLALELIALDANDPSRQTKKAELDCAEENVNTLVKALSWQDNGSIAPLDAKLVSKAPRFQIANLMECDKNHYVFPNIHLFMRRLEKTLDTHSVSHDAAWKAYLSASMVDHSVDQWYCEFLAPKDISWKDAKKVLVERFSEKASETKTAMDLFTMKMDRKGETLPAFALRFQTAMRDAQFKDSPELAMLCLFSLPKELWRCCR